MLLVVVLFAFPTELLGSGFSSKPADCRDFVVIGHRGASGYVPEHTIGSYALAITMGAQYIEPDIVITRDKQLVALHDNELSSTTDVAQHPEFTSRYKTQNLDGSSMSGWFTEDFTLEELRTLRTTERIPNIRPGNARMNHTFPIPTLQEIIDLLRSMQSGRQFPIGICPEIKHSTHFKRLGLPIEQRLVDTLHRNGFVGSKAPVLIQSIEISNLKQLKAITRIRLLQLFDSKELQPYDQVVSGSNLTYGEMATPEGLKEVAEYAYAVGPDKEYIIPRDQNGNLGCSTSFVSDAHRAGLKVNPYTFRAENAFLPAEFRSSDPAMSARGNLTGELNAYLDAGIDGVFADQPDLAVSLQKSCPKQKKFNNKDKSKTHVFVRTNTNREFTTNI